MFCRKSSIISCWLCGNNEHLVSQYGKDKGWDERKNPWELQLHVKLAF